MQGIQKTITKAFQIFKGDDIIAQKQDQLVKQLRTPEFKLNPGMPLVLTDAFFQSPEFIRRVSISGKNFCVFLVQPIHMGFLPARKPLAKQFPVLVRNLHFVNYSTFEPVSEQFYTFQEEINQITVEDAVIIIEVMGNIHSDDDLLEEVTGELQRVQLGGFLLLRAHLESRLDI